MKKRCLVIFYSLLGMVSLSAQSFQEAFQKDLAYAQYQDPNRQNHSNYFGKLSSGVGVGYEPGISLKSIDVEQQTVLASIPFFLQPHKQRLALLAQFDLPDLKEYHLLLTTRKGAFVENFPLQKNTIIDCEHLRPGMYFLQLCTRDQAKPLRQYKLVRY